MSARHEAAAKVLLHVFDNLQRLVQRDHRRSMMMRRHIPVEVQSSERGPRKNVGGGDCAAQAKHEGGSNQYWPRQYTVCVGDCRGGGGKDGNAQQSALLVARQPSRLA